LAQNLANTETPGFRAKDLIFREELNAALQGRVVPTRVEIPMDGHPQKIHPVVILAGEGRLRADGNDVNLDKQMVKLSGNTLLHNALIQVLTSQFTLLKTAINGR
jgi:flagellar basal-body rod protein FlgB